MIKDCPYCGRDNFNSKSGRSLHITRCIMKPLEDDDEEEEEITNDGPYCLVGFDKQDSQPKNIFELKLDQFVDHIDPHQYYITSGEAVAKAERLEKDMWKVAGQTRALVKLLKELKDDAKYLECTWEDGRLLLKKKNQRKPRSI